MGGTMSRQFSVRCRAPFRRRTVSGVAFVATALAFTFSASPVAADPVIGDSVARWEMREAPTTTGSPRVMLDTDNSRSVLNGFIGETVTLDGENHTFATDMPADGYAPGHTSVVPHHDDLNPGSGNFAFTIRYNTNYSFGNIMQKGQGTNLGGYWKLENPNRQPRCMFRGVAPGGGFVTRTGFIDGNSLGVQLSKGWHTITCERVMSPPPGVKPYVRMWVDGVAQKKAIGSSGTISNREPLSIGGKSNCGPTSSAKSCDYFIGQIDFIEIRKAFPVG